MLLCVMWDRYDSSSPRDKYYGSFLFFIFNAVLVGYYIMNVLLQAIGSFPLSASWPLCAATGTNVLSIILFSKDPPQVLTLMTRSWFPAPPSWKGWDTYFFQPHAQLYHRWRARGRKDHAGLMPFYTCFCGLLHLIPALSYTRKTT